MKSNNNICGVQKLNNIHGEGPNWILIIGGALLSTISIKIGCRLKQVFDSKYAGAAKGVGKPNLNRRTEACQLHAHLFSFHQQEDTSTCFWCQTGTSVGEVDTKKSSSSPRVADADSSLQLVTIPFVDITKENGRAIWGSSPERIDFSQQRPIHNSNSSESPCFSESSSDILNKREVIHKLRQQLKRRDEMILEMQTQTSDLQNSLRNHMTRLVQLQSQLDSANADLFESEREIQQLRKLIADNAVAEITSPKLLASAPNWQADANGHSNGYINSTNGLDLRYATASKSCRDGERVEMLKNEVHELKEVIEGKEFLLQSYKEQKLELSSQLKEMQLRLTSQVPNIL